MQVGPLCTKQFTHFYLAINSVHAMCRYWHNRTTELAPAHTQLRTLETNEVFQIYCWDLSCVCLCLCAHMCVCACVCTFRACWCSMIIASLPVFGEITAVVFAANKVPRGTKHPDAISHDWSVLLITVFSTTGFCKVFTHEGA